MPAPALKAEFDYYVDHQADIVAKYPGKYVVIKGGTILGAYDSELVAVRETARHTPIGTFLVQKAEPGSESYSQNFHSRVVFA